MSAISSRSRPAGYTTAGPAAAPIGGGVVLKDCLKFFDRPLAWPTPACVRLASEFPTVPLTRIETLMSMALSLTMNPSIETFRVVLAEQSTRARLDAEHDGRHGLA
jgi:hypothetical protein